jgi:hypothetical protein
MCLNHGLLDGLGLCCNRMVSNLISIFRYCRLRLIGVVGILGIMRIIYCPVCGYDWV